MDRGLDPQMQRILNDAASHTGQNDQLKTDQTAKWSFGTVSRPVAQERMLFSPHGQAPCQQPHQTLPRSHPSSSRVSLVPRNLYTQPADQPRVLSHADNYFRFTQNLRDGLPLSQPQGLGQNSLQTMNTIEDLPNAMLMQNHTQAPNVLRPFSSTQTFGPEATSFFTSQTSSSLGHLQPQRQQITPPFNLSGYVYSPEVPQSSPSSSALASQLSSPTTRASYRRAATRATHAQTLTSNQVTGRQNDDIFNEGDTREPETPARQITRSAGHEYPRKPPIPSIYTPEPQAKTVTNNGPALTVPHVSALALGHAPPMAHGIQLISPHELPDRIRHVFPYELFNAVQSKCFEPVYKSYDNVVVSAPTGSGKTAILELAICRVVEGCHSGTFKIVYLAPIKSLCSERLRDWTKKFSHLNLPCAELTGDTSHTEMSKVRAASIIVTTPEKWDSITRKWADHAKLVQMVKLFLIDEVHILKDPRGATLEAIVSRMKKMSAEVRFVALSATIPNSQDVATWLGKDHTSQHLPAHRETFGEDFRPVKLQRHVHGFNGMMNDWAFEKVLDGKLPGLIQKYTRRKPILVFCYTRKSCEQTAVLLAEWWSGQREQDRAWPTPKQRVNVTSRDLKDLLDCGIAYHHAGLDVQDRHAVETGFLGGNISIICCTSTLAVGVNLPCHLVVLKGSVGFQDGKLGEYSDLEVMQMLGRAGRPQFDDSAVAVIMTRSEKVDRYKKMISGQDTLESTLHLNFIELLNSEISLGTVKNAYDAKVWLNSTFLSVRMRQNPRYYNITGVGAEGSTEERLEQACERDIKLLQENRLVTSKDQFDCTEYGDAMSRYMIKFETMKLLLSIPPKAKTEEILEIICQAAEFKDLKMKPNERPILREFNKSPFIKYQVKETVATTAHKVSLMIQVQLGGVEYPNEKEFNMIKRQFMVDKSVIFEKVQRLMRCVIDCKSVDEDAIATRHALDLARSLSAEIWEYSNLQLRQLQGVGPSAVRTMVSSNINSIEKLDEKDASGIERIMSKNPPYGKKMKDNLATFPRLELKSEIVGKAPFKQGRRPKVYVKVILSYRGAKTPVWGGKRPSLTFMAETSDGRLVHFWRGNIAKLDKGFEIRFDVEVSSVDEQIKCWIACDEVVGTVKSSTLQHDIPSSHFPAPSPAEGRNTRELFNASIKKSLSTDEFGDDDFSEDDLVAAIKRIEKGSKNNDSDGFTNIDDLENSPQAKKLGVVKNGKADPERMSNGKYACQHNCRDGQLLKNGKSCKHRCCSEGLDKPPARKRKASASNYERDDELAKNRIFADGSAAVQSKKQKVLNNGTVTKFKSKKQSEKELEDIEFTDLLDETFTPISYTSLTPHDYRKLPNIYRSTQKNAIESTQWPKEKPQFSHEDDNRSDSGPFQEEKTIEKTTFQDDFGFDELSDDDFPTTTQLAGFSHDTVKLDDYKDNISAHTSRTKLSTPIFDDDPLDKLQAGMIELNDSLAPPPKTPRPRQSIAEKQFEIGTLENVVGGLDEMSSAMQDPESFITERVKEVESPNKAEEDITRARSLEADIEEVKNRRVTQAEQARQYVDSNHLPAWVNEFDSELIDSLRDYVDFID